MSHWPLRRMLGAVFGVIAAVTLVIAVLITTALVHLGHARTDRVDTYGPAVLASETLAKAYSDEQTGSKNGEIGWRLHSLERTPSLGCCARFEASKGI